jgi:hypothetical protein
MKIRVCVVTTVNIGGQWLTISLTHTLDSMRSAANAAVMHRHRSPACSGLLWKGPIGAESTFTSGLEA